MAYFNHAFVKCFNPSGVAESNTATSALTAGQIGLVGDKTWTTVDSIPGAISGSDQVGLLYFVQGSYHNVPGGDTIGNNPGHGGYAESVKSKGINPKYITRIWRQRCNPPRQASTCISVGPECAPCGTNLYLRVDVKGSAALRFLNHNAYAVGDSGGVCCDDDGNPNTQEYVPAEVALASAAQMILEDPIVAPFIKEGGGVSGGITITTASGTSQLPIATILADGYTPVQGLTEAKLCLEGAYVDTKFGNCSFDTRDFYGKEPVSIVATFLDESGDPCNDCGVTTSTPGVMGNTYGDTVLREILMTENYMQSPFNQGNKDSARIREIEGSDRILASVDRFDANGDPVMYEAFYFQHSVPRFNNPTGVFDNDQYLYKIYVPCDGSEAADEVSSFLQEVQEIMAKELGLDLEVFGGQGPEGPGEELP